MASSADMQLRLEDMIDFSMKVSLPNHMLHAVEFVRNWEAGSPKNHQEERAIAVIGKGQCIQFKTLSSRQPFCPLESTVRRKRIGLFPQ